MKVYGDVEAVNLSTGERWMRVSGDGENRLVKVMSHPLSYQYPVSKKELVELEDKRSSLIQDIVERLKASPQLVVEGKRSQMDEVRVAKVGETVIWHDSVGTPHEALVTAVWTPTCINTVFISSDESKTDPYGRQIERATSCTHKDTQKVHGFYWRFKDEEPNPYVPPLEK